MSESCGTPVRRNDGLGFKPVEGLWWAVSDLNAGPSGCKPDALTAELTARALNCKRLAHSAVADSASFLSNCPCSQNCGITNGSRGGFPRFAIGEHR